MANGPVTYVGVLWHRMTQWHSLHRKTPLMPSCAVDVPRDLAHNSFASAADKENVQWQAHFQNAASLNTENFCPAQLAHVRRRFQRIRARRSSCYDSTASSNPPFTAAELQAVLHYCEFGKAPGCDGIPYEAFACDFAWWKDALLSFFELCRMSKCVPSMWNMALLFPLPKGQLLHCINLVFRSPRS